LRQFLPDIQPTLHVVLSRRPAVCQAIRAVLTRLEESGDITPIGLDAPTPMAVHRSVIGVGHDHLVADLLEVLRDPLTLGRRLQQNPHARPAQENLRESLAGGRDPLIDNLHRLREEANLAFFLVEVDGTTLHGWSPRTP
jgi:hypothetical protein